MIIDRRGRLFGAVNIFDIIALLLILTVAGIAGITFKTHKPAYISTNVETESISIELSTNNTEGFAANAVKIGDLVKDKVTNAVIGRVTAVKLGDSVNFTYNSKGKAITTSFPGHVSLKITVAAKGTYADTGVTIGKTDYYINKLIDARVGITYFEFRITDLKVPAKEK